MYVTPEKLELNQQERARLASLHPGPDPSVDPSVNSSPDLSVDPSVDPSPEPSPDRSPDPSPDPTPKQVRKELAELHRQRRVRLVAIDEAHLVSAWA